MLAGAPERGHFGEAIKRMLKNRGAAAGIKPSALKVLAAIHRDAAKGASMWHVYLYPHHLFAGTGLSAYLHSDFSRIVGYRFQLDAICTNRTDGGYTLDMRRSTELTIPISNIESLRL